MYFALVLCGGLAAYSCKDGGRKSDAGDPTEPRFLKIDSLGIGSWRLVSVSPFDGSADTLVVDRPLERLILMSTSHVGFLEAIGRPDVIAGVSSPDYLYSEPLPLSQGTSVSEEHATLGNVRGGTGAERSEASGGAERSEASEPPRVPWETKPVDVGYDSAPDYEKIVALKPDLLLAYSVSAAKSPFLERLDQLGIRVFIVSEHLESHPLARAAYIRLFGALTGNMETADSVLSVVTENYTTLAEAVANSAERPRKVLMNIPYNDQWFVPSKENYLNCLVEDSGGTLLGTGSGKASSSVMSLEKAYSYSKEADLWLNTGWCQTMAQLLSVSPLFEDMVGNIRKNAAGAGFGEGPVAWNDNKRLSPKGGNDIWQSGVVRPDLVLRDLVSIMHPGLVIETEETVYYRALE
ncbi:MAG: ABC transporter substrate-binding protein [Bacteroidales bacterium]|nr:ABC transporter substrate-binding protein [Bacteroidales bacterium]